MEERLLKCFEIARIEGSTEKEILTKLYGESSTKVLKMPEYLIARKNGLNIMQAELATLVSQELKLRGIEGVLSRMESSKDATHYHKKRPRKNNKDEPDLKKKTKL
jgi:hypothetical protein